MTTNRPGEVWERARSSAWLRAILAYIGGPCIYAFVIAAGIRTKSDEFFGGQTPSWVVIWGYVGGISLPFVVGWICTRDMAFRRRYHRWVIGALIGVSSGATALIWLGIWLAVVGVDFNP
jgi:hypothetical protein